MHKDTLMAQDIKVPFRVLKKSKITYSNKFGVRSFFCRNVKHWSVCLVLDKPIFCSVFSPSFPAWP